MTQEALRRVNDICETIKRLDKCIDQINYAPVSHLTFRTIEDKF